MTDLIKLAEELDNNPEPGAHQDGLNMMAATALREAAAELEKLRAEIAEAKANRVQILSFLGAFMTAEYEGCLGVYLRALGKAADSLSDEAIAALKEGK